MLIFGNYLDVDPKSEAYAAAYRLKDCVSGILERPVEPSDDSGSRHYRLYIG
jgi:hypothetical protein